MCVDNGVYEVQGLNSWSPPNSECVHPDVWTRVYPFLKWIEKVTGLCEYYSTYLLHGALCQTMSTNYIAYLDETGNPSNHCLQTVINYTYMRP